MTFPGAALVLLLLAGCATAPPPPEDGRRLGWAVIAERNDFSAVGLSNLDVGYRNTERMRALLEGRGWPEGRIRILREFDGDDLRDAVRWLAGSADGDDLALLYVFSHGRHLEKLGWADLVPREWRRIGAAERVLVVDTCRAAAFAEAVPPPTLALAAVGPGEASWAGEPSEGLPIVGGVFTAFLTEALSGRASVQDAFRQAAEKQRDYLRRRVLTVPRFVEMYRSAGYHPDLDPGYPRPLLSDTIGRPVFLYDVESEEARWPTSRGSSTR